MKSILVERELWELVVTPPVQPTDLPAGPDAAEKVKAAYKSQKVQDMRALAIITLHVKSHLLHLIDEEGNAQKAWNSLHDASASRSQARVMALLEEFQAMKLKPRESLAQYFGRALTLWDQLLDANEELGEC